MDTTVLEWFLDDSAVDAISIVLSNLRVPVGGSMPGRAPNLNRQTEIGHANLMRDYLGPEPSYTHEIFRRRFRLPMPLFRRICADILATDSYFRQRADASGKQGASPEQILTVALRMLAYGAAADATDEYCRLAESTAMLCLKRFASGVAAVYEAEYLRSPNDEDVKDILSKNAARGFPVMLGSLDCMHWFWKNCPRARTGQYAGKDGKPSIVLEAVATQDLRIWHCFFGCVGSCNDHHTLDRSMLFRDLYNGKTMCEPYCLNGTWRSTPYYLVDGIYPDWTVFVKAYSAPDTVKRKYVTMQQEACRKDAERAFGALQARWHILAKPCKLWFQKDMAMIVKACIILHNMVIEFDAVNGNASENLRCPNGSVPFVQCDVNVFTINMARIRDASGHNTLRQDLVEHLWQVKGDQQ